MGHVSKRNADPVIRRVVDARLDVQARGPCHAGAVEACASGQPNSGKLGHVRDAVDLVSELVEFGVNVGAFCALEHVSEDDAEMASSRVRLRIFATSIGRPPRLSG